MINIVGEYIKYRAIAKQRHGIHSPFVYDFGDKCLRFSIPKTVLRDFMQFKKALRRDNTLIEISDFGAGSKKLSNHRKVKDIARVSGSPDKYAQLLYRLSKHYAPKNILELGTSLGLGTFMLAAGNDKAKITTVEGCPNTFTYTKAHFPKEYRENIQFVNSPFTDFLKNLDKETVFDLIFIDGDHRKKSLLEQIALLTPHINDETIIVLDDIRWTKDMFLAWEYFVKHLDFHLTMDLFKMGIILKRTHQQKEHFTIRY